MSDIQLRRVHKSYGKNAVVHGVDLDIKDGEFIVILGPSGCGKSTLLRMIAGLEEITAGEIAIGGTVVNGLEPRERGCAMVFQNYALYPHMTVTENIGYALKVAGVPKAERMRRIAEVARTLGLDEFLDRRPGQLSGGQRQRVAMGRAMIREPKVFLYDEPLSNLDAKLRVQMRIEIRKLHQRLGATSVFVTHDQVEAMTLADRIVVMNKGTIDQVGPPREIYQRPATTYVGGFIGAPGMNFVDGVIETAANRVLLADGQALPLDRRRYSTVTDGPVTAGIRAETIELVDDPSGIRATFDFAEEMGAAQMVHAELAGKTIVVHARDVHGFAPRAGLRLQVLARDVHLFDPKSGRRLQEAYIHDYAGEGAAALAEGGLGRAV
jgi:sn-glycerol 3-phosphate transport system ATP-binding protein